MLHYLDDLDSKMEAMRAQFERAGESEGAWTGYNPSLGRPLLNTAKFLVQEEELSEEEQNTAEPRAPVAAKKFVSTSITGTPILPASSPRKEIPKPTQKERKKREKERRRHDIRGA